MKSKSTSEKNCWVGLDWGDEKHHLVIIDDEGGKKIASFEVKHNPEGMKEMIERLRACARVLGVAIESKRHLVVQQLLHAGFTVYPINPKIAKTWREALKVQPSKSDPIDGDVLAHGLRNYHEAFRPLAPGDAQTRELTLLCADEIRLIQDRTALIQRLTATLKEYYPQALEMFSDFISPSSWDFVIAFPDAEKLRTASKKKLLGFFKVHHISLSDKWLKRLEKRTQPNAWHLDEATVAAKRRLAVACAKQLRTIEASLKEYRARIEELFDTHEDAGIFSSLPGAGPKLAPRILVCFGEDRARFDSAAAAQALSGAAPVSEKTGKQKKPTVKFRRACQKDFRATMHLFAHCSLKNCLWARAFYDQARDRGHSHALALRLLAAKWLKIIYRMWQENMMYDETKYLNALIKSGSPLVAYMNR